MPGQVIHRQPFSMENVTIGSEGDLLYTSLIDELYKLIVEQGHRSDEYYYWKLAKDSGHSIARFFWRGDGHAVYMMHKYYLLDNKMIFLDAGQHAYTP